MVRPILESIADEHRKSLLVYRLDIDENPQTPRDYQIMSIPTMIVFQDGAPVKQIVGAKPKAALLEDLAEYIAPVDDQSDVFEDTLALTLQNGRVRVAIISPDGTYSYLDSREDRHGILYLRTETARLQAQLVSQFEEILNSSYASKRDLIRFMEDNPELITGDDYRTAVSQVFLRHAEQAAGPSFVLQPLEGQLCDILEIEPPQHDIARLVKGVSMLSDVVLEAVARLRAYRDYFEEERNRVRIQDEHGLHLFRPKMFIIIGRSQRIDPLSRRRLESSMGDITLRTWDDVLARAKGRLRRGIP
jgi:hypothetical protein